MCATMKDLMERQMYEVVIQASANNKIVARETLRAYRKNVLAKCYGKLPAFPASSLAVHSTYPAP